MKLNTACSLTSVPVQQKVTSTFLFVGPATSAQTPRVPYAPARLHVCGATLRVLLPFKGAGSLFMMLPSGMLVAYVGCWVMTCTAFIITSVLAPLTVRPMPVSPAAALMSLGGGLDTPDVATRIHGFPTQKKTPHRMICGHQALYRTPGAGFMVLLLWCDLRVAMVLISLRLFVLLICPLRQRPGHRDQQCRTFFMVAHRWASFYATLRFMPFQSEGVMGYCHAFLLRQRSCPAELQATFGFILFCLTMHSGHLTGDRTLSRFSNMAVRITGLPLAATGLLRGARRTQRAPGRVAFLPIGSGLINSNPVAFSAPGSQQRRPPGAAPTGPLRIDLRLAGQRLLIAFSLFSVLLIAVSACARLITR